METKHLSAQEAFGSANLKREKALRMNYSFIKGCGKVCKEDYRKLNADLKEYLGCKTMTHYYLKRKRFIDMPVHIKEGIEAIFSSYSVSPEDIWEITSIEEQP